MLDGITMALSGKPEPRHQPGPEGSEECDPVAGPGASRSPGQRAAGGVAMLGGFTVAVATDRRRHPIADLLEAAGARTVSFQALRTISQPDADAILAASAAAAAAPVHEVVVSSAFGLRAWFGAARRDGCVDALLGRFAEARLLARDARAADGLRELGLTQIWSTSAGTTEDLFRYLLAQPMTGRRVVAQLDSEPLRELCHALRAAGAEVIEVLTYRSDPPNHRDVLRRLADQVAKRQVDAVAFVSAPATENLLEQAFVDQSTDDVLNAFLDDVLAGCLGPLTAEPLRAKGLTPLLARRAYPEELTAMLVEVLPQRALRVRFGSLTIEVRGQGVVVGDQLVPVQAGPIAVLRALARYPGRVLSAAEIRTRVPGWSAVDDHAIEMAVSRLRRSLDGTELDGAGLVQTVVKRGYRLAT
jgi:uroporphyrinogen-III synthase